MANYKLILDEGVLANFVEWLPELREGECYYIVLLARNKYVRDLPNFAKVALTKSDKQQLARIVTNKSGIRNKIKQLECEVGSYLTRDGVAVPQEALALYISVNPRSHIMATKEALKMMADYLTSKYQGYRLDQDVVSCIQKCCGNKIFMDLDFDDVDLPSTLDKVKTYINASCLTALKTRGGFHLLIKLDEIADEVKKSWYKGITALPGVDVRGDNLIPIPGCSQGMFMPTFVKIEEGVGSISKEEWLRIYYSLLAEQGRVPNRDVFDHGDAMLDGDTPQQAADKILEAFNYLDNDSDHAHRGKDCSCFTSE